MNIQKVNSDLKTEKCLPNNFFTIFLKKTQILNKIDSKLDFLKQSYTSNFIYHWKKKKKKGIMTHDCWCNLERSSGVVS